MVTDTNKLVIHGVPASQPSRTVYWTCLIKGLPFELNLGAGNRTDYYQSEAFLALNPVGGFPTIEDGEVVLSQMPAILMYLCEKYGWQDLYPKDFLIRSRINEYLFNHVTFTRLATLKLMAPHVTVALEGGGPGDPATAYDTTLREMINSAMADPKMLENGRRTVRRMIQVIEDHWLGPETPYLFNQTAPTIADIACYGEVPQLQWANILDYSDFPKLTAWMAEMRNVPHHDLVHRYNLELGDVRTQPNTMDRFMSASMAAVQALAEIEEVSISFAQ